jgi:hypothetical protein
VTYWDRKGQRHIRVGGFLLALVWTGGISDFCEGQARAVIKDERVVSALEEVRVKRTVWEEGESGPLFVQA